MVFFEAKLSIPSYTPYLVRQRLFSLIETNLNRSLICVTSDGGYGKTTLISSFIKEKNLPAVWYQLSQLDRDPQVFLSYFKTAIYQQISGDSKAVFDIPRENVEKELSNLSNILSTWPKKLIIVLDNFQFIHLCEEIETMLKLLIQQVSPNITFIITSRIRPNLNLVQLKLQNRLAEVKTQHLAFTEEEIKEFFVHLHNINIKNEEIGLILSKTEGWAASLQLLQDLIKDIDDANRSFFWLKFRGTPDIYDYLGSEIMSSQTEEVKLFLYKTCLLAELNDSVINTYLHITNADQTLKHLLENHLFIYKNQFDTIKYHTIFRSFLYKKLSEYFSISDIEELHKQLSYIYEERREYFHAHAHAIASKNFVFAAKLMVKMKRHYDSSQFLILVDRLEEISPEGFSGANNILYLTKCLPLRISKDLIKSIERQIMETKQSNPLKLANIQHQLGGLNFYTGDLNSSEQLYEKSLSHALNINDNELTSINYSLKALINWYKGKLDESLQYAQLALSYPDKNDTFHSHHIANWIIAEIHLDKGELDKGEFLLHETLKISKQRHDSTIIYPYCSMGKYYRLKGDYEESLKWMRKAEAVCLEFNLEYDFGWTYMEMSITYMELKDFEQAEFYLLKAIKELADSDYLNCLAKKLLLNVYQQINKLEQVEGLQKQIDKIIDNKNYYWLRRESTLGRSDIFINERQQQEKKLFLQTLGDFEIKYGDKLITIKRKTSLKIFQYFIANRNKKLYKETIIDSIFPEGSIKSLSNHFYVSLSELRKAIEPITVKTKTDSLFIKRNLEHYSLSLDYIYLDVDEFTQLLENKKGFTQSERIINLKKAEQLYQGDFFEEYVYHDFLEEERERLRFQYINLLQELADYEWEVGNFKESIHYYEKILNKEPYKETVYIDYITRLLGANYFLQAKKVFEQYKKFIEDELGIQVDKKIENLFLDIPNQK